MGLSGDGAHSNNAEYILVESIVPRLYLVTKLIMDLSTAQNNKVGMKNSTDLRFLHHERWCLF